MAGIAQMCSSRSSFVLVIFIISFALTPSRAEVDAEIISSPNVVTPTKAFSDVEDFGRDNSWTSKGLFWSGKIESGSNQFNITDPPSDDKDVILAFTKPKASTLLKDFNLTGPLTKANFTMKYYVRVLDTSFNMKGVLYDTGNINNTHTLFDMSHDDLASENNTWVTITAQHDTDLVPDSFTSKPFTVKLEFSSSSMIYDDDIPQYQFVVVDELSLTGSEIIISLPQVAANTTMAPVQTNVPVTVPPTLAPVLKNTTLAPLLNASTPAPSGNETIAPSGNNETISNTTVGTNNNNATEAPVVVTTAAKNNTNIVEPTNPEGHTKDDGLKEEVEKVAKAIWDAFYVFLALFCACLVALIILIYKARNSRDDAAPPAVATYNPRTASYRLDSTGSSNYDNPGYRNEPV